MIYSEEQSSVRSRLDEIEERGLQLSGEGLDQLVDVQQAIQTLEKRVIGEVSEVLRSSDTGRVSSLAEIRTGLSALLAKLDAIPKKTTVENAILRRLYFASIDTRVESIADAGFGTFDWLLRDESEPPAGEDDDATTPDIDSEPGQLGPTSSPQGEGDVQGSVAPEEATRGSTAPGEESEANSTTKGGNLGNPQAKPRTRDRSGADGREDRLRHRTRQSFLAWLRTGNHVYHISGKAGSGKSTLMKFLGQNSRLRAELEEWTGGKKLVFASFFFWNSGDDGQRSLGGLYRSLLFETLRQYPELIRDAFPEYFAGAEADAAGWDGMPFRLSELRDAMGVIIRKRSFPSHRFCFFIDGLDEFQADLNTDHWELAQSLRRWAVSPDVKICVSSRPHEEFLQAFDPALRMDLHEMTRGDVRRFVYGMLEQEPNYTEAGSALSDMVSDIADRADGVFLWVRLVVRSLVDGIRHRYSAEMLKQRLKGSPKGLEPLFDQLFNSIDPGDREISDKILLLAASNGSMNALKVSWLEDLADPDFPFNAPFCAYSDDEIRSRHKPIRSQLDSLSKGLLEIKDRHSSGLSTYKIAKYPMAAKDIYFEQRVDFFHRTVREYLNDPERLRIMKQRLGQRFNPVDADNRLSLAEFKFSRTMKDYFKPQGIGETSLVGCFSSCFRVDGFQDNPRFLDEYGRILEHHRRTPFSYPAETRDNDGIIAWSQWFDSTNGGGTVSGRDISYIHWLASQGCHEYVISKVLADRSLIHPHDGRSLLLGVSRTLKSQPQFTRDLLKAGAAPDEQITVRYRSDNDDRNLDLHERCELTHVTTVWAVFLFFLAHELMSEYYPSEYYDEYTSIKFLIVDEFIKHGANSDVYFLLQDKKRTEAAANYADTGATSDETEVRSAGDGGGDLVLVTLEDLVLQNRPSNMNVLMEHILGQKGWWFWRSAKHAIVTASSPWLGDARKHETKYRRVQAGSLDSMKGKYVVKSVHVNGRQLETGFYVAWF